MRADFEVTADEDGLTVAAVLRRHIADLPWSRARQLCQRGKVAVAGVRILDPAARVERGQPVQVDEARVTPPPPGPRIEIVYEDPQVVVIDKPTGVSSVPYEKREAGTAMDLVRAVWRKEGKHATQQPLFVVHRIDKETSGLLAFAKTKAAEQSIAMLFRKHDVERTYLCVVHGEVRDGRIESQLVTDRGDGLRGSTRHPGQGKRAVTHVRVLETLPRATVCEVRLETGKTHQIRIHLAESGHPLVGERVYIRDYAGRGGVPLPADRLLLHAATLGFVHPVTEKRIALTSAPPPDFTQALDHLRRLR